MSICHIKSTKEFEEILEENDYVISKFTAAWCAPCRKITPTYRALAQKFEGDILFTEIDVDIDEVEEILEKYKVSPIPDCIGFKKGEEKGRFVGANPEKIKEMVLQLRKE